MNNSTKAFELSTLFYFIFGSLLLNACQVNESANGSSITPVTCQEEQEFDPNEFCQESGLILATQADCDTDLECQILSSTLGCGEEITVLCYMPSDPECIEEGGVISPDAICEEEGLFVASVGECETDSTCRVINYEGSCGFSSEVWCRESQCTEAAYPTAELICEGEGLVLATEEECDAGLECQIIEFLSECNVSSLAFCKSPNDPECTEEGAVPPESICEGEGLVLASEEECVENSTCQTITTIGACNRSVETLCKEPTDQCLAEASCGPNTVPSSPCLRGEESCETVTLCGQSLSCRPEFSCDAAPNCAEGEVGNRFGCEEDESNCYATTVCAETIFCRPDELCRAAPSCGEDEVESFEPCLASESSTACHAVSMCGSTIICRPAF